MAFHIGQKVVCVNSVFNDGTCDGGRPHMPSRGQVYVIRDLVLEVGADGEEYDACHLEEIRNPVILWMKVGTRVPVRREIGFWIGRFRPLSERKTDIGAFTKILDEVRAGNVREIA